MSARPGAAAARALTWTNPAALLAGDATRLWDSATVVARREPAGGRVEASAGPARWFDLASLTKPLVLGSLFARQIEQGRVGPGSRIGQWLDLPRPLRDLTLEALARHRSGLVAWRDWEAGLDPHDPTAPGQLRERILAERPGPATTCYGDTNAILLGFWLEALTGQDLADAFADDVLSPLGLQTTLRYGAPPLPADRSVAPGGFCAWRGRVVHGEIHDPRAAILGRHAGHAGLFGTAAGVEALATAWLRGLAPDTHGGLPGSSAAVLRLLTRIPRQGERPWFWDRIGPGPSQAGRLAGPRSFGHLAFTGPALWIDPDRQALTLLLCNRLQGIAGEAAFRRWRPDLFDALWQAADRAT